MNSKTMCHISREKSGSTPGGMNTISFQQVRSAPKTHPIVYKTYVLLRAPLRHPAITWRQSAMNLVTPVSREGARAYYIFFKRVAVCYTVASCSRRCAGTLLSSGVYRVSSKVSLMCNNYGLSNKHVLNTL